jgi:S-adenosylmethionine hydrolase
MSRRKKVQNEPKLHESLEGFNIQVDEFGKIQMNLPMEELNKFLNNNTQDIKIHNTRKKREKK